METHTKSIKYSRRAIFFYLMIVCFIAFSLYMFFLGRTIFDLVARSKVEAEIKMVSSSIFSLELEVLAYSNEITIQKAKELGFVDNSEPVFLSKKSFISLR